LQIDAEQPNSNHDFGADIMPRMVASGTRVFAFPYSGYWVDVGTLETYWQAHMDLLGDPPRFDLNDRSWVVHTKSEERPPAMIHSGAVVRDSLIADGAVIRSGAVVDRSVLSPGVHVGPGTHIRQSIILTDTHIDADTQVEKAVLDKIVYVGERSRIGAESAAQITTVGKAAKLPPETVIAPGAEIPADSRPEAFVPEPLPPTTI
jgi:glucose-1-phosphate adenylyltransferase